MKLQKISIMFSAVTASLALSFGPFAESSRAWDLAQAPAQSGAMPPQAPSLFRQAGQKLLDSAQKRVLHDMNQKLNSPAQPQTPAAAPGFAPSPLNGTTTTSSPDLSTTRQLPPCRSWVTPGEKPLASLLCIHGLGLQSNSYEFFGKEQSNRGLAVYAIDVRGFGSWINSKGKAKVNFDDCLEDIRQSLIAIHAANPGTPVYLLGESMGGAIALRAASMYPSLVDGLISSVPAGERFGQGKTSMKVFMNLLSGVNIANVGNDLVNQATKSAKLKAQWEGDPLSRLNLSPQELIQFQDFMNNNHEAAKNVVDMPVLFVQGIGDQLVKPEGTWELFNSVAAKDKSFFAVPGEHLIFEEAQTQDAGPRDQNFRVISSWLSTKVGHRNRSRTSFINTQGLESQAQMVDSGQYANAITQLEQIRQQRPEDSNVLGLLAKAYLQSGQSDNARYFFRQAMKADRSGGTQARALNTYLLGVNGSALRTTATSSAGLNSVPPASSVSPLAGLARILDQTRNVATGTTIGGTGSGPGAKATVYAFYANWADQCKGLSDSLNQLSSAYGTGVEINRVNIDDAASEPLIEQFKVGPIPTVVFVAPNGQVGSTIIGESSYNNYAKALESVNPSYGRMQ